MGLLNTTLILLALVARVQAADIPAGDAGALRRAIETHPAGAGGRFVIPPGEYRVDDTLVFAGWRDVEIIATGVTFLRTDNAKQGLRFVDCQGVTLRGGVTRCATMPFTQGDILAIDADRKALTLRVDAGYPAALLDVETTGYAFDRATRQWKPKTFDYNVKSIAPATADGTVRLALQHPVGPELAVGDLMAFRGPVVQDVMLERCARMTIDGLRIEGGTGFCLQEAGGEGRNRYAYTVTYPTPREGHAAPLISANADAFHSSGVRNGPVVEGCVFEGMCDDGVAIHGYYGGVVDRVEGGFVGAFLWDRPFLREGDPVHLFDDESALLGETSLISLDLMPDGYAPATPIADDRFKGAKKFFRLRLADAAAVPQATRFSTPANNGSGFVVRGNVIRNHRARGVIVKASDGVIEKNVIDGSTIAAIMIGPELWWAEGCYSRNVVVRENVLRHAGYAHTGAWHTQAGVISVLGAGKQRDGAGPLGYGHRNITIERNRFEASDGCQILVNGVAGLSIRDNLFDDVLRLPTNRGSDDAVDGVTMIDIRRTRGGLIVGNTLTRPGAALRERLRLAPTVRDVSSENAFTR